MAQFAQRITSSDRIAVAPARVHEVLTDPDLLARLTPLVAGITVEGDRWTWRLTGVQAMGVKVAPEFTTMMEIGPNSIAFEPAPDADERASADGQIDVTPGRTEDETVVAIDLIAVVELPLPKMASRGVKTVMFQTMKVGGSRFADNLLKHLGNPWHRGLDVRDAS